jgi:hypothetical protein
MIGTITDHKRQFFSMERQMTISFNASTITDHKKQFFSMEGQITFFSYENTITALFFDQTCQIVPAGPSYASSGLGTLEWCGLGPAAARALLQHYGPPHNSVNDCVATPTLHTTPLLQPVISSTLVL